MSAIVTIPFNYQPANTLSSTGSYTVPVGKYALITYTLTARVWNTTSGSTINLSDGNSSDVKIVTGSVWVKSGDVISTSLSNASGSFTNSTASSTAVNATGVTTSSLLINSSAVAKSTAFLAHTCWSTNSSSIVVTMNGASDVMYHIAEYNLIS